ncbi:hypothetical protein WAE56_20225 [Iodobacter sp. LRB]|uniref:major capsid protein n=1 Tax=unclassified Iodobacter TaxID=235634 RepID=UPI000C1203C2|nr:hypothetical protein [Iodobacter sp. BJB302]PHV01531.1 hypothetical protein CSQ88_11840 [Iodobacter sp. BJB302]
MGRLSNLRVVDPVLSQLALGYSNLEYVGELLMPTVEVQKEGGKIPKFGKEAFKIYNTERALRAKSNRINPEGLTGIDVVLDEHDLEYPIDYREEQESAFPLQSNATFVATEGIDLRREKMIADMAQNPANYAASNKIALSGTSRFTDRVNSDPIGVVEVGKEAIRAKIGRYPNTMIIGASSQSVLKNHPQLLDRIKYSMKGIVTADLMRDIFEIENIAVGKAVYANDQDVFSDLWLDNIILAYVPSKRAGQSRTPYEPAFGYTIRKNKPIVDTRTEDGKVEIVRCTNIFRPFIVGAEAGYLISDTNA